MQVWETVQGKGAAGSRTFCSGSAFVHWRDHAEVFETVGFLNPISANFTGSQDPERIKGGEVSSGYLETLGVKALVGQIFDISEYKMGGARNDVMLSYSLWVDHFSSDPKIVGRTISIDNVSRSIIGILPKDALIRNDVLFIVPVVIEQDSWRLDPTLYWLTVIARLKNNISMCAAQDYLNRLRIERRGDFPLEGSKTGVQLSLLRDDITAPAKGTLMLMCGAVTLTLVLACINVATLLCTHIGARTREIATRTALGAPAFVLFREILAEVGILVSAGAILGAVVADVGVTVLAYPALAAVPLSDMDQTLFNRVTGGALPEIFRPKVDLGGCTSSRGSFAARSKS